MALLEKDITVKTSTIPSSGQGLFSKVFIPKGKRIVEYKGRVSTWKEVSHNNGENGYIYFLNRNHVIDASKAIASFARYSNDAAGLRRIKGLSNNAEYIEDGTRVFIVAKKDIMPGEEIFVGYGKEYWQTIRHNIRVEAQRKKEAALKQAKKERKELARANKLAKHKEAVARKKARRDELSLRKKTKLREVKEARKAKKEALAARKKEGKSKKPAPAKKSLAATNRRLTKKTASKARVASGKPETRVHSTKSK